MKWELLEAQRNLDEVLDLAHDKGPQFITWNDEVCVLLTKQEYLRLTASDPEITERQTEQPETENPRVGAGPQG
jgi:hypothetical protein